MQFRERNSDMEKSVKTGRGGRRPGAGRPKGDARLYTFRAGGEIAAAIDASKDKSAFIKDSIRQAIQGHEADFSAIGDAVPASEARSFSIPSFDLRVVAGFPVPLDNDERSQDIDMLRLLCPHPESSYLIRVQGDSMIDAGIESGDIVIVDKSRREASEREIAVCELNGEYTLKRVAVEKDGTRWLVPANPEFPRFPIKDGDSFCVWGVVTYIIHKARD